MIGAYDLRIVGKRGGPARVSTATYVTLGEAFKAALPLVNRLRRHSARFISWTWHEPCGWSEEPVIDALHVFRQDCVKLAKAGCHAPVRGRCYVGFAF